MGWGLFSLWQNITVFSFGGPEFFEGLMTKLRIISNSPSFCPGPGHLSLPVAWRESREIRALLFIIKPDLCINRPLLEPDSITTKRSYIRSSPFGSHDPLLSQSRLLDPAESNLEAPVVSAMYSHNLDFGRETACYVLGGYSSDAGCISQSSWMYSVTAELDWGTDCCPLVVSLSLYADFKRPALSVSAWFEKHNEKGRII